MWRRHLSSRPTSKLPHLHAIRPVRKVAGFDVSTILRWRERGLRKRRHPFSDGKTFGSALPAQLHFQSSVEYHNGCVNTVSWNKAGTLLVSGSDDRHLCIFDPFEPSSASLKARIRSGHTANIFSAKFLPCSDDNVIVSCASDGSIAVTFLDRPETYGANLLSCHVCSVYEVATIPFDPHLWLTAAEDGTVRRFDRREKLKCRPCRDDVIITCRRAVGAIDVNPANPWQVAIGCSDGTCRIYDMRRCTRPCTDETDTEGIQYCFCPFGTPQRSRRVTSVEFGANGQELLVSFSSDYVYLVDTTKVSDKPVDFSQAQEDNSSVVKKVRFRGDWSDTGPSARPETEQPEPAAAATPTSHTLVGEPNNDEPAEPVEPRNEPPEPGEQARPPGQRSTRPVRVVMDRFTNLVTQWLRRQLEDDDDNDSEPESTPAPSTASAGGAQATSSTTLQPSASRADVSEVLRTLVTSVDRRVGGAVEHDDQQQQGAGASAMEEEVAERPQPVVSPASQDPSPSQAARAGELSALSSVLFQVRPGAGSRGRRYYGQGSPSDLSLPMARQVDDVAMMSSGRDDGSGETEESRDEREAAELTESARMAAPTTLGLQTPPVERNPEWVSREPENRDLPEPTNVMSDSEPSELLPPEREPVGEAEPNDSATEEPQPTLVAVAEEPPEPDDPTEPGPSTSQETQHDVERRQRRAAVLEKLKQEAKRRMNQRDNLWRSLESVPQLETIAVFKGHRNCRTMLKQATFWQSSYIMSGSDCGHIFIWRRCDQQVAGVIEADGHVVNCVRPHPHFPVLASSGIDYNVKLFVPQAGAVMDKEKVDDIIRRNEVMLEETKDTVTVPAAFMIRMLASMNAFAARRRAEENQNENEEGEGDQNIQDAE